MSVSVRLGDDVRQLLRVFWRSRMRFYGITVGNYGLGFFSYKPSPTEDEVRVTADRLRRLTR